MSDGLCGFVAGVGVGFLIAAYITAWVGRRKRIW